MDLGAEPASLLALEEDEAIPAADGLGGPPPGLGGARLVMTFSSPGAAPETGALRVGCASCGCFESGRFARVAAANCLRVSTAASVEPSLRYQASRANGLPSPAAISQKLTFKRLPGRAFSATAHAISLVQEACRAWSSAGNAGSVKSPRRGPPARQTSGRAAPTRAWMISSSQSNRRNPRWSCEPGGVRYGRASGHFFSPPPPQSGGRLNVHKLTANESCFIRSVSPRRAIPASAASRNAVSQ